MDKDTAKNRTLNGSAMSTFVGCRVMVTSGIRALDYIAGVMQRVGQPTGQNALQGGANRKVTKDG